MYHFLPLSLSTVLLMWQGIAALPPCVGCKVVVLTTSLNLFCPCLSTHLSLCLSLLQSRIANYFALSGCVIALKTLARERTAHPLKEGRMKRKKGNFVDNGIEWVRAGEKLEGGEAFCWHKLQTLVCCLHTQCFRHHTLLKNTLNQTKMCCWSLK